MTDRFKEKCNESANCDRLGKIIYEENEIRYDGNLASLELVEDCYVNGTIIGTTNTKGITINTIGSETLYEKEIQAQIGIKYGDTDEEYINMGKYTIDKPSATETSNLGQYKGYDYLDKLNADYKCSYTDFDSITVADILQDLCNQCGLEIASLEFENSDFPVSGNIFENYKCKDVLSDILELASSFGTIDKETNKLTFKQLGKESVVTLTKDNYSVLTKNQVYGPINSFTVKESQIEGENVSIQDDESIEANGENMFAIVDNIFCYTPELRKRALDSIWKNLKGLTYVDCRIESYTGLPYLNAGDKITVEDDEGNFFDTYVLKHTFTYDGTFKSVIESPALTKQQNAIKSDVSLREKLNQTVINVYKDKKQIEALVTEASDTTEKLTKFEMDLDSIKQQVSEIDDFTKDGETIDGNLNLSDIGNGYLLNLKIRPKDEHVAPTFPNFTIYPSDSTFTRDGLSIVRIKNLTTGSFTDYEIPVDLYYKDENTYDFLEYKYGNDKCTVTKKLKMVDGVLTEMETPVQTEYDFPMIDTTEGNYSIALLNYDQAYIYAKMIGKNDFSDNFALKSELSSAITQTKEYIQSEVKNLSTQVNGDIENLSSSITQTAEEIKGEVSDYKKTTDGAIESLSSSLTQTASSLSSEVKSYKETVDGQIEEVNGKFELYIEKDVEKLMSVFNLAVNQVVIDSDNFKLDAKGNITANNASLNNVTIRKGNIELEDTGTYDEYRISISSTGALQGYYNEIGSRKIKLYTDSNDTCSSISSDEFLIKTNGIFGSERNLFRITATMAAYVYLYNRDNNASTITLDGQNGDITANNVKINNTPTASNHAVRLQDLNNAIDQLKRDNGLK